MSDSRKHWRNLLRRASPSMIRCTEPTTIHDLRIGYETWEAIVMMGFLQTWTVAILGLLHDSGIKKFTGYDRSILVQTSLCPNIPYWQHVSRGLKQSDKVQWDLSLFGFLLTMKMSLRKLCAISCWCSYWPYWFAKFWLFLCGKYQDISQIGRSNERMEVFRLLLMRDDWFASEREPWT